MESLYIGLDVGGMSIKAGLVDENGAIIYKSTRKTNALEGGPGVLLQDMKELIREHTKYAKSHGYAVKGIGFGIPGVVNNEKGTIDYACNLGVENLNLRSYLSDLHLPICLSNDASVACLGEERFGAAKEYDNVVMLTLGTGVGGGVVIDDKLFEGVEGKGTELGHMTIVVDGEQCSCGRKGCFETYASASALLRMTKSEMIKNRHSLMWDYSNRSLEEVNGLTSFECAKKGDVSAQIVIDTYVKYLSEGILNMCNIFRPQVILLGGGISNQGDYLVDKVVKYCEERNYGYKNTPKVEIRVATLKNDAGIVGAACLAMDYVKKIEKK